MAVEKIVDFFLRRQHTTQLFTGKRNNFSVCEINRDDYNGAHLKNKMKFPRLCRLGQ